MQTKKDEEAQEKEREHTHTISNDAKEKMNKVKRKREKDTGTHKHEKRELKSVDEGREGGVRIWSWMKSETLGGGGEMSFRSIRNGGNK